MTMLERAPGRCSALMLCLLLITMAAGDGVAQRTTKPEQRVLMRLASDSAVVGHYRLTARERQRLVFDIPEDDPRLTLLKEATQPKQVKTDIAVTMVSVPREDEEERRYTLYWLGFGVSGDDIRALSPLVWDSIFQKVGRRAALNFTPRGRPLGVEVPSEAVRPVAQALATSLQGLALGLPGDSVEAGSTWTDNVAVPIRAPDGSQKLVAVQVTYRLRRVDVEPDATRVRVEFDGEPLNAGLEGATVSGKYFGESVFAVAEGRYERVMALANLEISWVDESGLPPSRSLVEWQAELNRN